MLGKISCQMPDKISCCWARYHDGQDIMLGKISPCSSSSSSSSSSIINVFNSVTPSTNVIVIVDVSRTIGSSIRVVVMVVVMMVAIILQHELIFINLGLLLSYHTRTCLHDSLDDGQWMMTMAVVVLWVLLLVVVVAVVAVVPPARSPT